MKKSTVALIGSGIVLASIVLFLSFFLTASDVGVSGADALRISFHSIGYVIPVILGLLVSAGIMYIGVKNDWQEDMKGVGALVAIVVIIWTTAFTKPANVKTDPIGSSISTEDINYLRTKGYKG